MQYLMDNNTTSRCRVGLADLCLRYFISYNLLFLLPLILIHKVIQFQDLILTGWRDDDILGFATWGAPNVDPSSLFQCAETVANVASTMWQLHHEFLVTR
jgi:hypothetical protein